MRLEAGEACGVAKAKPVFMQCAGCRCVAMNPIPTGDQVAAFYQNYHAVTDWVKKKDKKIARARKRIAALKLLLGRKGRFLDVGGSIGTAAEAARRAGFEAVVQEPDAEATARGRELFPDVEHVEGFLGDLDLANPFDLIFCAEVVEHVPDPSVFMAELFALLKPGGLIYFTTPDCGHFRRPKHFLDWKSVKPPEHIVLFTKAGLKALAAQAGFQKIMFQPYLKPGIRMIARKAK